MPRRPRIAVANFPHHIVQRGHNRKAVFVTDSDRLTYLDTLREFREKLQIRVYGYCLMTNHVHLVINPGNKAANLSVLMKQLAGRHTRRINRLKHRTGTCWEGRFKCSPIESDRYLLACIRYVDLNPVRAKIVEKPEDFRWSSYRARVGLSDCDWLDADPCFRALADDQHNRQMRYREFVERGVREQELQFIREAVQRNQLTGSEFFVTEVEQRTGDRILHRSRGRPGAGREPLRK